MKKIIMLFMTLIMALPLASQNVEDIKFLGIPINGDERHMMEELKDKGFRQIQDKCLEGWFNGRASLVFIEPYRIIVRPQIFVDEIQVKKDYNNLLKQLGIDNNYIELHQQNPIPANEDIEIQMVVYKKEYKAIFNPNVKITDDIEAYVVNVCKDMTEDETNQFLTDWAMRQYNRGNISFVIHRWDYNKYSVDITYENNRNIEQ